MSYVGHNGGPPQVRLTPKTKIECIKGALARSDLTAQQKCIAIKIIAEADAEWSAEVRTADLQQAASAKDRETVFRATRHLDAIGVASKTSGQGQVGRYRVLPPSIVSAVVEAYNEAMATGPARPDQSVENWSGETRRHNRSASPQKPVGSNPTSEPVKPDQSAQTRPVSPDQSTRAEVSNIYNNINNLPTNTPSPSEQDTAREGEEAVGFGVFVNCETIRHKAFTINLKGIECQLVGAVPLEEIKQVALGHALQWATDIADGKTNVVPKSTASFIRQSIQNQRTKAAHLDYRPTARATRAKGTVPRPDGKSFSELNAELIREMEAKR